ncbi:MAG: phosphate signaling complex protein PhoU [Acidimicrobiales bacterium]
MHGAGLYTQLIVLSLGGSTVTLASRRLDIEEMFDTLERERVNQIAIVGDAFGRPMVRALDENPDRWDLASLCLVASSGVMWSEPVKQGLLKHHPGMLLVDAFSSSEAVGMGQSLSSGASAVHTAQFTLGENSVVINTGGEKVFPEEVEEALKTYPGVHDAVAVGIPDDTFGEVVAAVVEADGNVDSPALIAHVRSKLAAYKARKQVLLIDTIGRAPNGLQAPPRLRGRHRGRWLNPRRHIRTCQSPGPGCRAGGRMGDLALRRRYGAAVPPSHEIRKRFHHQLDEIDAKVIRLFALVTESVAAATDSLLANDTEAARELTERDALVDQLEVDLEQVAERELLMEQPMARDMRYLVSVLRIVPELERSGDLAEHVAQRAVTGLALRLTPTVRGLLEQMGTTCAEMWRGAADAWAERDPEAAERLDKVDDRLDDLHDQLVEELGLADLALPDALQTTLVGRFYERLGDHAVHISERIRYLAIGT